VALGEAEMTQVRGRWPLAGFGHRQAQVAKLVGEFRHGCWERCLQTRDNETLVKMWYMYINIRHCIV